MDIKEFWYQVIFEIGKKEIFLGQLIAVGLGLVLLYILAYLLNKRWLERFFTFEKTKENDQKKIRRISFICIGLIAALVVVLGLGLDVSVSQNDTNPLFKLKVSTILQAILIYFIARLIDEVLSGLLTHRYEQRRNQQIEEGIYKYEGRGKGVKVGHIVQPIVYLLAATFIVQELNITWGLPMPWQDGEPLRINTVLTAILILLFTRLFLWILTEIILYPFYRQNKINAGSQYAINKLLTYFIIVFAVVATLQFLGINLTVLLGGAAALLVGVGLGLQQTFNDLTCGIILLFERTVEVGDIVDMNGLVGTVKKIGIRTSLVETRESVSVIVPNSKLVAENVVNWSHFDAKARFSISVGVAYGTDTEVVKNALLEVASQHEKIIRRPNPEVRFVNFGDSSLDFELLFWSRDLVLIERTKSDIRFAVDKRFREENISIPFPQRDIWVRKEQ